PEPVPEEFEGVNFSAAADRRDQCSEDTQHDHRHADRVDRLADRFDDIRERHGSGATTAVVNSLCNSTGGGTVGQVNPGRMEKQCRRIRPPKSSNAPTRATSGLFRSTTPPTSTTPTAGS